MHLINNPEVTVGSVWRDKDDGFRVVVAGVFEYEDAEYVIFKSVLFGYMKIYTWAQFFGCFSPE